MAVLRPPADSDLPQRLPAGEQTVATGMVLALARREAFVHGVRIHLTPLETRLLTALAQAGGRPLAVDELIRRVWPGADGADPVYVWVAVRRLRQKLEPDPSRPVFVHTVRGGGYRLGDPATGD
jgi:DNA-binding response OmpR family regulator